MSTESKSEESSDELLEHYRPIALRAVLAACAVKGEHKKPATVQDLEIFGALPEGFHMPHDLES
ncbi:hypothetical protein [Rhizobium gallicum]|uniref:hypothetical protein n=1 Tax=Rhizobium gallicum TaxID=56730 RepID=UPI001EF7F5C6|nr:hypothetical protein [Rhizobium gallicum]ULJ74620.1 hypothetical protein L2W42_30115 [Rhizobium gallicum]